jgi:hypothetical protein
MTQAERKIILLALNKATGGTFSEHLCKLEKEFVNLENQIEANFAKLATIENGINEAKLMLKSHGITV